jgi:hypothetical protein
MQIRQLPLPVTLTPVYRPFARKLEPRVRFRALMGMSWSVERMKFDCEHAGHDQVMLESCVRVKTPITIQSGGHSVTVKYVHVPANKTCAGREPEDDTVWTFR